MEESDLLFLQLIETFNDELRQILNSYRSLYDSQAITTNLEEYSVFMEPVLAWFYKARTTYQTNIKLSVDMFFRKYRSEIIFSLVITCLVVFTIVYGNHLAAKGIKIRQWTWYNLIILLPFVALIFLQKWLELPPIATINQKPNGWLSTWGVGAIFGLLDVIVVKLIIHPEPYTELPPSFQVFPYSIFLYASGAIDVEFFNRMLPLALMLLINKFVFRGNYRNYFIVFAGVVTSLLEPIQQFPEGATWFVIYAVVSGLMMNAWQFMSYIKYGFIASLAVRWGHYLIWHILLGVYIEWIELAR